MAKGYWIAAYKAIVDPDKVAAYSAIAGPALTAAGGRFLARTNEVAAFESGLAQRVVLIEFPSREAALACYRSAEYQRALKALDGGADRDVRIVEALD